LRRRERFRSFYALTATTFMVQFIFQTAFAQQVRQYGLAAAASLLLAGILFALTLVQLRTMQGKGK